MINNEMIVDVKIVKRSNVYEVYGADYEGCDGFNEYFVYQSDAYAYKEKMEKQGYFVEMRYLGGDYWP